MNPNLVGVDHATAGVLKKVLNRGIGEENLSKDVVGKLNAGKTALEAARAAQEAAQLAREAARAAQEAALSYNLTILPESFSQFIITHNLNSDNLFAYFIDIKTNQNIEAAWTIIDKNSIQVSFGNVPINAQVKVIITG